MPLMNDLDDTDRKIIEILAKDSRKSFREIAKQLGISVDTIARRFETLERNKVIQPIIRVDFSKLGYEAIVLFAIKVASQSELSQITEKVSKVPDVTAVMESTGEYDLMVNAVVRNIAHIFAVGEEISKVVGVRRVSLVHFMPSDAITIYPPPIWHNLNIDRI